MYKYEGVAVKRRRSVSRQMTDFGIGREGGGPRPTERANHGANVLYCMLYIMCV